MPIVSGNGECARRGNPFHPPSSSLNLESYSATHFHVERVTDYYHTFQSPQLAMSSLLK